MAEVADGPRLGLLRFQIGQAMLGADHQAQVGPAAPAGGTEGLGGPANGTAEARFI